MTLDEAIDFTSGLPCWSGEVSPEPLDGGLSNINLRVRDGDRVYVARIGGDIPFHGVMRWNELAVSRAAHAAEISPEVHFHAPNVLVIGFIDGRTCKEEDVRDPNNLPRIIELVKQFHRDIPVFLRGPVLIFWVFHVIRDYVARLREGGSAYKSQLGDLLDTAEKLKAAVGAVEIVLGHNDLLAANILDDGSRFWLIDWEYGGFNTPLFDLGGLATNNGLSEAQEIAMLEQYFEEDAVHRWRPYQAMKCASLMRETMWSMVSEIHSVLDLDYASYTAENHERLSRALQDFANS